MDNHDADFTDPSLGEPHYSTRIYKGYLYYLKKKFGVEGAKRILSKTGLSWKYLTCESNWVSEKYAEIFYDVLSSEPGIDPDFSYQAGKLSMSNEVQGAVQVMAIQLLDPLYIFKQITYFSKQFNKTDRLEIRKLVSNQLSLVFESRRKTRHLGLILDNWRGFLEQVPSILGLPPARCVIMPQSESLALFEVNWVPNRLHRILRIARTILGAAFGISLVLGYFLFASICTTLFLISCFAIEKLKQHLNGTSQESLKGLLKESEDRYQELHESKNRLDRRYKEAHLLAGVLQRISSSQEIDSLIKTTLKEIQESLQYDRVIYMSFNREQNTLSTAASQGFEPKQSKLIHGYEIDLNQSTQSGMHLGNVFKERKNILIPITSDYFESLSEEGKMMLYLTKSRSFLACTVATQGNLHGILLVDYIRADKTLDKDDLYFIQNFAKQLAICIENTHTLLEERRLRSTFQRFVPAEVIQSMMGEIAINLEDGVNQNVTVLFSDIRQFTRRSSQIEPKLLIKAINYYFKEMTNIVYQQQGIVDKFLGDGLFAVFNSFGTVENHAAKAVLAAYEMQQAMPAINQWIKDHLFQNQVWDPMEIGIGIHTGHAIVGNLGTENKTEFTAIGETVNTAARIGELSKKHPSSILVSEEVFQKTSIFFEFNSLGPSKIRGIERELNIFLVTAERLVSQAKNHRTIKEAA